MAFTDNIVTEGQFWRRCVGALESIIGGIPISSGSVTVNNGIVNPVPVQQADLNADIDEVTVFGGALTTYKDAASATVTYIGEAVVGSSVASAVWRIQKIDTGSAALVTWAGTGIFDQVWNNRAALTYS